MSEYLIKSTVSIAVAYILYYIFARKATKFKYVRTYFYLAVIASLVFPCFNELPNIFTRETQVAPPQFLSVMMEEPMPEYQDVMTATNLNMVAEKSPEISLLNILTGIYLLGITILTIRFLLGLFRIFKLVFHNKINKINGDRLILIDDLKHSFSFFNLIFINKSNFNTGVDNVMLRHERIHVRQGHSYDTVFFELLSIIFWFNPFIWLFRSSIKEIHEYLADEGILKTEELSPHEYVRLLLEQATCFKTYMPANNFNGSIIKKRVQMIASNPNRKMYVIASILIVSIVITESLSGFSFMNRQMKQVVAPKVDIIKKESSSPAINKVLKPEIVVRDTAKKQVKQNQPEEDNQAVTPPLFKGTTDPKESNIAFNKFVNINMAYPPELYNSGKKGDVYIKYSIDEQGKVYNTALGNEEMKKFLNEKIEKLKDNPEEVAKYQKRLNMVIDDSLCINEALRIVRSIPYTPAKNKSGKAVKAEYNSCNIYFRDPKSRSSNDLFREYVKYNLKYPEEAKAKGVEGIVYLKYDLDKDGHYGNIQLGDMRKFFKDRNDTASLNKISEHPLLVAEAMRLLKERPGYYIEKFDSTTRVAGGSCSIDFFLPK